LARSAASTGPSQSTSPSTCTSDGPPTVVPSRCRSSVSCGTEVVTTSPEPGTLSDLWRAAAVTHGERLVLTDRLGPLTYRELDLLASQAAAVLASVTPPRSRVLVVLPNGRELCAVLLGAWTAGLTAVPAGAAATPYQLQWLLADAAPAVVVTSAGAEVPKGHRVITTDDLLSGPPVAAVARREPDPDDVALLLYTSGTSSRPKGIVSAHRAATWVAKAISSVLRYRPDDVVYLRVPMSFDYGLYQLLLVALVGASLAFPPGELSARELQHVRNSEATVVPVVPSLAELLVRLARRDDAPTSVRLFTNTGEALLGALADSLRTSFPGTGVVCMYGMSECKRISIAEPDEDIARPGTVGRPLPGTQVDVVGEDGSPLPPGEVGQFRVVGPHVMAGYHGDPPLDHERFVPDDAGYGAALMTGDFGWCDADGRLYFESRRDDVFKRHGLRMSVAEVEEAVASVPRVTAVASRRPGANGTLTVWLVTELEDQAVRDQVVERIGVQRAPDCFVVVDALPLTGNGKVDRAALRDPQTAAGSGRTS
jgi:acyl-CoA synthetase (AMP-forming)/AMP-acid ligase II